MREHCLRIDRDGLLEARHRTLEGWSGVLSAGELLQRRNGQGAAAGRKGRAAVGIDGDGAIGGGDGLGEKGCGVAAAIIHDVGPLPVEVGQPFVDRSALWIDVQRAAARLDGVVERIDHGGASPAPDLEDLGPARALALVHARVGARNIGCHGEGISGLVEDSEGLVGVAAHPFFGPYFEQDVALEAFGIVQPPLVVEGLLGCGEGLIEVAAVKGDQGLGIAGLLDRRTAPGAKVGEGRVT